MDGQETPGSLERALAPLKDHPHVYAIYGNHDLEGAAHPATIQGLRAVGARLLVDEGVTVETRAGPVHVVGTDFRWRDRQGHLTQLFSTIRRPEGALRVVLTHDPGSFKHIPDGEGDLVLCGHTHGGQVGLVSLGLDWTVVSGWFRYPDHGLWSHGKNRMYVHRGTGHYGFPLRLGVPAEESVLTLSRVGVAS